MAKRLRRTGESSDEQISCFKEDNPESEYTMQDERLLMDSEESVKQIRRYPKEETP